MIACFRAIRANPAERRFYGMGEAIAHGQVTHAVANPVALAERVNVYGNMAHESDHVRDLAFARVIVHEATQYQQNYGRR